MKKSMYALHGWLGLNFGLVLFVVCFSGSIAVVSHEIDWLCTPGLRVSPGETRADWTTMTRAVREEVPDGTIRYAYAPLGRRFACEFLVENDVGTERVYVDPYRGTVNGRAAWFNTQRFFRDFHRRFFWYGWWGIWLVAVFGFVLLASAATGLIFYKRWWAKLFVLRLRGGFRTFCSDLHRMVGVWTLWFAMVIGVTGVWYFVEIPLGWSTRSSSPMPRVPESTLESLGLSDASSDSGEGESGAEAARLPTERWVEIAREAIPELDVRTIWFPGEPDVAARIEGQASAWLVRDRSNKVLIDPYTGDVLLRQRAESLGMLDRWVDTADPLHFGTFGGLTSKLVWLGFGLLLSAAMPTGAYLWVRRRAQAAAGITKRFRDQGGDPLEWAESIRRGTGRRIATGVVSTGAIWGLALFATWEALAKQFESAGASYGWGALGGGPVVVVIGSFVLLVTAATVVWFRVVWFPTAAGLHASSKTSRTSSK